MIEEVEIRRNVKHLTMNQSKADQQTDAGTLWKGKAFKSQGPPSLAADGSFSSLRKMGAAKNSLQQLSHKNNNILDDECPESDQDSGSYDLIDLIGSPCSHRDDGWMENRESSLRGLNGYLSSAKAYPVLLSDGDESNTAYSDTMSELVLDSETEDDGQTGNMSMSQYSGPNVSPELSTTSLTLSLLNNQDNKLAVNSGDVEDDNVSDDSHCSITSGPSKLPRPVAQGPCTHCLRLYMRMRRQPNWTKSVVKGESGVIMSPRDDTKLSIF